MIINTDKKKRAEIKAYEEYRRSFYLSKQLFVIFIIFYIVAEMCIAGWLTKTIVKDNLHNRVLREFEIRYKGEISLERGVYTGETDFGYFFGKGIFLFGNGTVYSGVWNNNDLDGMGSIILPNEGTYTGEFVSSRKEGYGCFTWKDGSIYKGIWHDDRMEGSGTYTSSRGYIFSGRFLNNKLYDGTVSFINETGKYLIIYEQGEAISAEIHFQDGTNYKGDIDANYISGQGELTFANHDKYIGSFFNGFREGKGDYLWENGDRYTGEWKNDCMNGEGIYVFSNGDSLQGTFADNSFINGNYHITNKEGVYLFQVEDGKPIYVEIKSSNGTTYKGGMKNFKLNGKADIEYKNGDKYSGAVVDGKKEGEGKYTWKNGARYDGTWVNDKMEGYGTYKYPDSEKAYKLAGQFTAGKPDGDCIYYISINEYYKTIWSNGKCIKVIE